jgi:diacylglycerol kinase family enzyme
VVHVLLVRNSDSGSADQVDPAAVLVDRGCTITDVDIADAARWARDRSTRHLSGIGRVVVAGGDGSIGVAAALATMADVPLGVVPAGTANDFARAMQLPDELEQACVLAATGDSLRDVDLARIDGPDAHFVNVASIGLAPVAASHAQPLKRGIGALAYPVGAALAAIRSRPITVVARVDGHLVWSGKAWQAMVASTGAFGGWADTGSTRLGDRQLDLVIVPAGRRTRELVYDAASLTRGELAARAGVHHERGRRIELTLHRAPRMVVDGELLDVDERCIIAEVTDRPVRVVVG